MPAASTRIAKKADAAAQPKNVGGQIGPNTPFAASKMKTMFPIAYVITQNQIVFARSGVTEVSSVMAESAG